MEKWLYLVVGGALGTLSRFGLAGVVTQRLGAAFPWGTLAVNLTGCFVAGFLDILFEKKFLLNPQHRLLLMTAFCGAFTTFSSIILETSHLLKENQFLSAFLNIMLSVCFGFIAFKIGAVVAELI